MAEPSTARYGVPPTVSANAWAADDPDAEIPRAIVRLLPRQQVSDTRSHCAKRWAHGLGERTRPSPKKVAVQTIFKVSKQADFGMRAKSKWGSGTFCALQRQALDSQTPVW